MLALCCLLVDGGVDLGGDDGLLADGGQHGAEDVLAVVERVPDLLAEVAVGDLEVVAGVSLVVHEREVVVVGDVEQLEVPARDVGHVHVVGGRADVLVLLVGEDVEGDEMDLGVAVLARLGRGHLDDLAGAALKVKAL